MERITIKAKLDNSLNSKFLKIMFLRMFQDFPGGAVVKNPPTNAGNTGSSPGLGRSHMLQGN